MKHSIYVFLAALFLLASCSPRLTPFTQKFYDSYEFSEGDLKKIQFYLSEDIVLRRSLQGGNVEIAEGEVKIIDGRKVDEVVIPRKTPGVLMFIPKENRFAISFEEGSNSRYLIFGPSRKVNNQYMLLASDWEKRRGTVTYGGKKYLTDSHSALARLLIDLKEVNKMEKKTYVAKGRTVN